MVVLQGTKLKLPQSPSLSSPPVSSLLFDPHSLSLALMHSDSSFSLYPSFSPFSLSSISPPHTFIPSPTSSATFLRLQTSNPNSTPRVLFVAAAPHLCGAAILLRFWILRNSQSFARAKVVCNQSGIKFDLRKFGVVFNSSHGVSIKLIGSINVLAMYSVTNRRIWIFAAKMAGDEDDGVSVKLMKTAVIDCFGPVFSISVSLGFLILGEENGVRVFHLRPLVKGRVKKQSKLVGRKLNLSNGTIQIINGSDDSNSKSTGSEGSGEISSNGYLEGKIQRQYDYVKLRPLRLRQDSREGIAYFMPFKAREDKNFESTKMPLNTMKAISIEVLSPNKFLILDSNGDLHVLCLPNQVLGSETPHLKRLTHTMKVQKLAVLPDTPAGNWTIFVSDGHYTVHMMTVSDMDTAVNESDMEDGEEKLLQISGIQAIFAGEKVQDLVSFAANATLILGQGNIFAYAIS